MLSDDDFAHSVAWLQSADSKKAVPALMNLNMDPSGDARLLPYLERLLEDRTPAVISLPYSYGEVCFLAARALAAERAVLGIQDPVILHNVVLPLDTGELGVIEDNVGITGTKGGTEGALGIFRTLREMGHLPTADLEFVGGDIRIIKTAKET